MNILLTPPSAHNFGNVKIACELAGMHHEKQGNYDKALALFRQAEHCYQLWGSASKCRQMKEKINYLDHDH